MKNCQSPLENTTQSFQFSRDKNARPKICTTGCCTIKGTSFHKTSCIHWRSSNLIDFEVASNHILLTRNLDWWADIQITKIKCAAKIFSKEKVQFSLWGEKKCQFSSQKKNCASKKSTCLVNYTQFRMCAKIFTGWALSSRKTCWKVENCM